MDLPASTAALKAKLDAMPGARGEPMSAARGKTPLVLIYKVTGKTFAILGARTEAFVILKCDPVLVETLREQYAGVGHRSHLDRRFWIAVDLDADAPPDEVERLVDHSCAQVTAGLTRKQRSDLAALAP